jgi:hypothetical protein
VGSSLAWGAQSQPYHGDHRGQHWSYASLRSQRRQLRHSQRCRARRGDVLVIADDLSKTHDGDKQLFTSLTFSIV